MEFISAQEIAGLLSQANTIILDVRTQAAFDQSHIPGAQHMTMTSVGQFCETANKSDQIIVYCYKGISCQLIAKHLTDVGFENVFNLTGGFDAWEAAKLPTEST